MEIKNFFKEDGKTLNEILQELIGVYAYDLLENEA